MAFVFCSKILLFHLRKINFYDNFKSNNIISTLIFKFFSPKEKSLCNLIYLGQNIVFFDRGKVRKITEGMEI